MSSRASALLLLAGLAAADSANVLPSAPVLAWQLKDVGCFVHYNMATMVGSQGCQDGVSVPPPLSAWRPTALDTDAWVSTCAAMGGSRIIYVAKHGCGFAAWNSSVPGYSYTAQNAPMPVDVVAAFVASARKAGLGVGFYYSDATNSFCRVSGGFVQPGVAKPGQMNVTQAQYNAFVVAHLTELWSNYGALTELWFDGGFDPALAPTLTALLNKLQPNAVVFGGAGLNNNALRWIGTEDGLAPYPTWSRTAAGGNGQGDPDGDSWTPAETDFTLQNGDNWFYSSTAGVHSPAQLRQMYEQSSGANTGLIIDIAPFPNGTVPAEQVAAASALGDYVRACYSTPLASSSGSYTISLALGAQPVALDRVQLREDQSKGQLVRAFSITATLADGSSVPLCTGGSSIGNKYICRLTAPVAAVALTFNATSVVGGVPTISQFAAFSCGALAAEADAKWEAAHAAIIEMAAAKEAKEAEAPPKPAATAEGLDPDALSQRYRNWTYYPTWVIPPACLNAATCAAHCNTTSGVGCTTDVAQVVQLPEEVGSGLWRAFYLQFDGVGYETYSASSTDMVHFKLDDPTLVPGQPGIVYSPREGRPPMNDVKPAQGEWDYGSQTFIGPLLTDYNVSATRVLRRATPDHSYWYAYGAYPQRNVYEPAPGADGFASSQDGLNWVRRTPHATVDTLADHGAQAWESGQVYAPFIIPAPDGTLADFYNAGGAGGREQSGAAYLPGGADALPGYDFSINASLWVRDPANPTLPNDKVASFQASDPKVFFDDAQGVWVMIYFCNGGTPGGGASICVAFSSDQRSWAKAAEPIYGNGGHPAGLDKCHAHKSWLTGDGKTDRLYLYYTGVTGDGCDTRGILLLTSTPL